MCVLCVCVCALEFVKETADRDNDVDVEDWFDEKKNSNSNNNNAFNPFLTTSKLQRKQRRKSSTKRQRPVFPLSFGLVQGEALAADKPNLHLAIPTFSGDSSSNNNSTEKINQPFVDLANPWNGRVTVFDCIGTDFLAAG
jgi:hypothetical protein